MKKLLLAGLILATFIVQAQEGEEEDKKKKKADFLGEIVLGLNRSGIYGDSESYDGALFGGQLGITLNLLNFSERVRLRGEVNYSMQGGKYKYADTDYPNEPSYGGEGKLRLNYLTAPCVVRYQSPGGFFAEGGIQPALLLSAKDKYEGGSANYKDQVNKFDLGVPVGVGYQTKNRIGIGLRVVPGLTNINKNSSSYANNKDRNFVCSLRGTYSF